MLPVLSTEIKRREDFGSLLNTYGLTGTAVEIGVDRAEFSVNLMRQWNGGRYVGVDPWHPTYNYGVFIGKDREADYQHCMEVLSEFRDRMDITLHRCDSRAAAALVGNALDFVYIDGDHKYDSVWEDIKLWYPKLRVGGILAGHDYNGDWQDHVRTAVTEFAFSLEKKVAYILGDAASWYLFK